MEIVAMSQNLGPGAWRSQNGIFEDRWPALAATIQRVQPDILMLQEAEGWPADGHARLIRAEADLEMDGVLAPSPSGLGPAIFYRRATMGRRTYQNHDYSAHETHHGFETLGWNLPVLPATLPAGSVHLTPYGGPRAESQVSFIGTRVLRPGVGYAILGGDFNYAPVAGPPPLVGAMRPYNKGSRLKVTDPESPGPDEPDRAVAWRIARKGFVDVAWHLYKQTGDEELLRRTATDDRIDWILISFALAPCIVDYGVVEGGSDHAGVWARLDLSLAATDNVWEYK
ncbi:endonuclease/exonuclease/phosphatase family protein [Streptomyces halobius]|uniref:Endonuclease/exonuclease/phosphatase family protein n=1 Tax=Streptomyces halobius TaxID=2879846 RepID=A0ABY4ML02_9ACTN|nr:endonuclease/exonuclease/phosphatase family protein [Streptomyces halobius]UQA97105.1 endonuclease/exonuclease/phosphatase family protein [Streptomyces halobius]